MAYRFVRVIFFAITAALAGSTWAQAPEPEEADEGSPITEPAIPMNNPFLKRYFAADGAFPREGSTKGFAALEALAADPALNPAERALVHGRIAFRYGRTNERPKALRALESARTARASASAAELAALGMDLDAQLLGDEAAIQARYGNSLEAARLQRLLERRVWERMRRASGDPASTEYKRARDDWVDSVLSSVVYNIRVGRLSEYREYARSVEQGGVLQGASPNLLGVVANAKARAALAAGDHETAIRESRKALDLFKRAGQKDFGANTQSARHTLVIALVSEGRFGECLADSDVLLAQFSEPEVRGAFSLDVAQGLHHACHGDLAAAEAAAQASVDYRTRRYGREHYLTKESEGQVLFYRLQRQGVAANVSAIRRFVDRVAGARNEWADMQESPQYFVVPVMHRVLEGIHEMRKAGQQPGAELTDDGFRIVEWLKLNASQGALLDGAARLAAQTPELRALVEREQALKAERAASIGRAFRLGNIVEKVSKEDDKGKTARAEKALKVAEQQLRKHEGDLADVRRELSTRFPAYREMVNPTPLTVAETRALLRKGETYISTFATRRATLAWAVEAGSLVEVATSDLGRQELSRLANRYRESIERRATDSSSAPDLDAGRKLRESLGVPSRLAGDTLIVAPDSIMGRVPLQALPNPEGAPERWLGERWAIADIPGATSLKLLRDRRVARAGEPLAGFADPQFAAAPAQPAPRAVRSVLRTNGESSGTFDYSSLAPLPETRDEILAIAAALGAKAEGNILLGKEATRSAVLKAKLDDRRVVAFATHGIKPGEIPRVAQAALAMANEGAGLTDSLLTTEDVVGLRLNADWVVLSACSTGAYSDDEDQTLSGLSRAFFIAGSRSMLVTHWGVESESAKRLVVETFRNYAEGKSKAESLALAQRAMASGKLGKDFTHPFFWAAYFLAGDTR